MFKKKLPYNLSREGVLPHTQEHWKYEHPAVQVQAGNEVANVLRS